MTITGNVGAGETEGLPPDADRVIWNPTGQLARDLDDHYFPRPGSFLIGAGNPRFVVRDDFNATERQTVCDAGAYIFNASANPGWTIAPGFKGVVELPK